MQHSSRRAFLATALTVSVATTGGDATSISTLVEEVARKYRNLAGFTRTEMNYSLGDRLLGAPEVFTLAARLPEVRYQISATTTRAALSIGPTPESSADMRAFQRK